MSFLIIGIGLLAQLFFSARIIVQWFVSEKNKRVISNTLFWVFSLCGSMAMVIYGCLKNDFSIILGQFIAYYIYIGNLRLKGLWDRQNVILRYGLISIPLLAIFLRINESPTFFFNLFNNENIPLILLVYGSIGQIIFTFRFIYQWIYSKKENESVLPPTFWWISLTGSMIIVSYGAMVKDPILILGQTFGLVSYIRNLMIGRKSEKTKSSL